MTKKVLVTGGTVFVSRYIAEYYFAKGDDVYVLNRNTREQSEGVKLIQAGSHLQKMFHWRLINIGVNMERIKLKQKQL